MRTARLFLYFLLLTNCSHSTPFRVPAFQVKSNPAPAEFAAGAARLDITPPPGFPLGGHGPAGNIAVGYWTRLNARAFYFRPSNSDPFAMVSVDLFAVPEGLTHKVVQLV